MQIYGFQKTTLLDYPGHVAATVFTGGCNFRCPFCHNGELVLGVERAAAEVVANVDTFRQDRKDTVDWSSKVSCIDEEEILAYLRKRRGILQGVCITGGEPTLQPDLEEFIRKVKELGYLVKLDTNGYCPKVLQRLLDTGLLDYVAMDIKANRDNYGRAAGVSKLDMDRIEESVELLKHSSIPYEFRTTVVKGIHTVEEFETIGRWLAGSKVYYLQAFRESENLLEHLESEKGENVLQGDLSRAIEEQWNYEDTIGTCKRFGTYSREDMEQMADLARKYIDKVMLRGVE